MEQQVYASKKEKKPFHQDCFTNYQTFLPSPVFKPFATAHLMNMGKQEELHSA